MLRHRQGSRPRRRRVGFAAALGVACAVAATVPSACSEEEVVDPSYLLVELVPEDSQGAVPVAARVAVKAGGTEILGAA